MRRSESSLVLSERFEKRTSEIIEPLSREEKKESISARMLLSPFISQRWPQSLRFDSEIIARVSNQRANQSLEPTRGSVMPRAIESVSKCRNRNPFLSAAH